MKKPSIFQDMREARDWFWEAAASHKDMYTRMNAAKHKKAPLWLIKKLSEDENEKVRKAALQRIVNSNEGIANSAETKEG